MLRLIAIILLLMLAIRLVVRLMQRLAAASRPRPQPTARPRDPRQLKQLVECPRCGTFFEPKRGLPQRTGDPAPVCSEACREAPARPDTPASASASAEEQRSQHG